MEAPDANRLRSMARLRNGIRARPGDALGRDRRISNASESAMDRENPFDPCPGAPGGESR